MSEPTLNLEPAKQKMQPMEKCSNCGLTHPPRRIIDVPLSNLRDQFTMTECVLKQRQVMHALLKQIGAVTPCPSCAGDTVRIGVGANSRGYFTPDGEPHVCQKEQVG